MADGSSVTYLVSTGYDPTREFGVHPFDPELDLPWPADLEPELSAKDREAPTLAQAREQGLLPTYAESTARYAELRGALHSPVPEVRRRGRRPGRGHSRATTRPTTTAGPNARLSSSTNGLSPCTQWPPATGGAPA